MNPRQQVQQRITFLQEQLDSLDHYLPETYQFLLAEMDHQQRHLMELKIQDFYKDLSNEHQNQNPDTGNPEQDQKSNHRSKGVCQ
jgi:hypothetical protein